MTGTISAVMRAIIDRVYPVGIIVDFAVEMDPNSAVGFGTQGQTDAAIARLKREAAALGANGVVLMGVGSTPSAGGMSVGAGSYGGNVAGGIGIGIPTTQKRAAGIAIFVPAAAVIPADQPPAQ